MNRVEIFLAIEAERAAQDAKWGGSPHDQQHGSWSWSYTLIRHLGKYVQALEDGDKTKACHQLIRLAAISTAALENAPDLQNHQWPESQGATE